MLLTKLSFTLILLHFSFEKRALFKTRKLVKKSNTVLSAQVFELLDIKRKHFLKFDITKTVPCLIAMVVKKNHLQTLIKILRFCSWGTDSKTTVNNKVSFP